MVGRLLSHYRIDAELGRGGMGVVYRAEDTKLDRTVALKLLPASALSSDDDRARFYREAKAAAQLHHANIAAVFEIDEAIPEGAGSDELRPFIAMEFVEGTTLADRIATGPLKLDEVLRIATQIARGLQAAHAKDIVHRDIKSGNIMLTKSGDAKILDFGLAQTTASTKLTRLGTTLGTVAYMSPEQARGEVVDHRTDIWSLGILIYEMTSGRSPFSAEHEQALVYEILNEDPEPLTAIRTGVPLEIERIVNKCLSKNIKKRYQHTDDLIADMSAVGDAIVSNNSRYLSRAGSATSAPQRSGRWRLPLAAAVGAIVTALAFGLSTPDAPEESLPLKLRLHIPGISEVHFPELAPDRKNIYFTGGNYRTGDANLFALSLETMQVEEIISGGFMGKISPTGNGLAYVTGLSGLPALYRVALPRGRPVMITETGIGHVWLTDSTLAYSTLDGRRIVSINVNTLVEHDLVRLDEGSETPSRLWANGLSRDRQHLLFMHEYYDGSPWQIHEYDLTSSRSSLLVDGGTNPLPLGDDVLAYQLWEGGPVVAQLLKDGYTATDGLWAEILPGATFGKVSGATSGDLLVVEEDQGSFYFVSRTGPGSADTLFAMPDNLGLRDWAVNSTRSSLMLITNSPGDDLNASVRIADLSSGRITTIDETAGVKLYATFAGDERHVYYARVDDGVTHTVFRVATTGLASPIRVEDAFEIVESSARPISAVLRPRDTWLSAELILRNTDSGSEQVLDTTGSSGATRTAVRFSPDGSLLMRRRHDKTIIYEVDTGAIHDVPHSLYVWGPGIVYLYGHNGSQLIRQRYRTAGGFALVGEPEVLYDAGPSFAGIAWVEPNRIVTMEANQQRDYSVVQWWPNFSASVRAATASAK